MTVRTTEQIAPEMMLDLTKQLQQLSFNQPTTAELEEALALVPQITTVLKSWISARHLNVAHAARAAEFRERHPELTPVLEKYLETARDLQATVHPAFHGALAPFTQRNSA